MSLTITRNYSDGQGLTKAMLDAQNDSIETFINSTKISSAELQAGAVATSNIASGAVDSTKMATASVGTSALIDANVTTAKIADSNVTTAKIATGAVTQAKREIRTTGTTVGAGGVAISASCGDFSTSSSTTIGVTNLAVTLTTLGSPVEIRLQGTSSGGEIQSIGNTEARAFIEIYRDATLISSNKVGAVSNGSSNVRTAIPPSSIFYTDSPGAGTYVYSVNALVEVGGPLLIKNTQVVAKET